PGAKSRVSLHRGRQTAFRRVFDNSGMCSAPGWRTEEGQGAAGSDANGAAAAPPREGQQPMSVNEESVFADALAVQDPRERAALLGGACAGSPGLRRNVESLLPAYAAGQFLEAPAPALAAEELAPGERAGALIGPYRLLQQLGEGGMGTVWLAEQQEPVCRQVALKVIKAGLDSR